MKKQRIQTSWTPNLAYAIGLIASDGCLQEHNRVSFVSKDYELVEKFRKSLNINNKIGSKARGGETEKKYYYVSFKDKTFYEFLNEVGIYRRKSKTIGPLKIPDNYFGDFIRGEFDGDGSFYTSWDKRWKNSPVFTTAFCSASPAFIEWLQSKLLELYGIKGFVTKGVGVIILRYLKGSSFILFDKMYNSPDILYLQRKYDKIQDAIRLNDELKLKALPIQNKFKFVMIMPD